MPQNKKPKLNKGQKQTVAVELAELFFEFWQNRRSKEEIEAVAPTQSFLEDSCVLEQQP